MESLDSTVVKEKESQPQAHADPGPNTCSVTPDQCVESSPLHSDPEDSSLLCSSPPVEDSEGTASTIFSSTPGPQINLPGPEGSGSQKTTPQSLSVPQDLYQVSQQLQVSQALFGPNQVQIQQPSVPQCLPQVQLQVQAPVSKPQNSTLSQSSSSPQLVRILVPQQQPDLPAAGLSKGEDHPAVQQHTQNSKSVPTDVLK